MNDTPVTFTQSSERPIKQAMLNGAKLRCPHCGQGKLFRAYLKSADACSKCGEEFFHHRADDLPPYLAILIVGHVLVGAMLHMEMVWRIPPMTYLLWMVPMAVIMPVAMLPSLKGAVIGLQWSRRMHGFGEDSGNQ